VTGPGMDLFGSAGLPILVLADTSAEPRDESFHAARQVLRCLATAVRQDPIRRDLARVRLVCYGAVATAPVDWALHDSLPALPRLPQPARLSAALRTVRQAIEASVANANSASLAVDIVVLIRSTPDLDSAAELSALAPSLPWIGHLVAIGVGPTLRREDVDTISGDALLGVEVTGDALVRRLPMADFTATMPATPEWYRLRREVSPTILVEPPMVDFGRVPVGASATRTFRVAAHEPLEAKCRAGDVQISRSGEVIKLYWPTSPLPGGALLGFTGIELRTPSSTMTVPLSGRIVIDDSRVVSSVVERLVDRGVVDRAAKARLSEEVAEAGLDPAAVDVGLMRALGARGQVDLSWLEAGSKSFKLRLAVTSGGAASRRHSAVLGNRAQGGRRAATNDWAIKIYPDPETNDRATFISRDHLVLRIRSNGVQAESVRRGVDVFLDSVARGRLDSTELQSGAQLWLGMDDESRGVLGLAVQVAHDLAGRPVAVKLRRMNNGAEEEDYLLAAPPLVLGRDGLRSAAAEAIRDDELLIWCQADGVFWADKVDGPGVPVRVGEVLAVDGGPPGAGRVDYVVEECEERRLLE